MRIRSSDLIEPLAAILAMGALIWLGLMIMAPFLASVIWGAILVYTTWKPYQWLVRLCRGSRFSAALLLMGALLTFLVLPLLMAGFEFASQAATLIKTISQQFQMGWPSLPAWISTFPYLGEWVNGFWIQLGQGDPALLERIRGLSGPVASGLLHFGGIVGGGFLLLVLSLIVAFFFYLHGENAAAWLKGMMWRIAGEKGEALLNVAAGTVRGVVYGFLGTALVQGVLAWFSFFIAGVPNSLTLGFASCFLSILPGGPGLIGLPAAAWLYYQGHTGWAIFMAIWMIFVVGTADNVVKPLFIGQESDLPFILILFGVLGGALAFGLLGVFLGPTLLAVCYALLGSWVRGGTGINADKI
ncbi:AI-2E family transporter [Iodobacter arcticus]|uniref:AI-2E family transporter n=1 Tax=Iodobacter arcticus TaxID=590593 RepID=A0ABW2QWD5_9NEIS